MRNSSFSALVLLILLIAAVVFALTPHERHRAAELPGPLWSAR